MSYFFVRKQVDFSLDVLIIRCLLAMYYVLRNIGIVNYHTSTCQLLLLLKEAGQFFWHCNRGLAGKILAHVGCCFSILRWPIC